MNIEKPHRLNLRRLLLAVGVGVLIATAIYGTQRFFSHDPEVGFMQDNHKSYPVHKDIPTTIFWVGEEGDPLTNDNIHNISSSWVVDWRASYGGVDNPHERCEGYKPCGFEPKENPFYFALPFFEYNEQGLKPASELEVIPWYDGKIKAGESILKNRWIEIEYDGKKAYAQWEDAGPFGLDDAGYVFGEERHKDPRAGLDVSPAVAGYLGIDGKANTSWRFVEERDVPEGPWREIITTSGPSW